MICLPIFKSINGRYTERLIRVSTKTVLFISLYGGACFFLVPKIAKPFGRVPLPVYSSSQIKPLNLLTCVLNRHYVTPELLETTKAVSMKMEQAYSGSVVSYLDANFPFFDGFPLLPHLSHDDGEKLDLAFYYVDGKSGEPYNQLTPSFIGYGVYVDPEDGEANYPEKCEQQGHWQYGMLAAIVPQRNKDKLLADPERTRELVRLFALENSIGKIFIEPHLKSRWNLNFDKVRYHGCHAVRHDDHIHVQLK